MEQILILYYSGVGNTKKVAERMLAYLSPFCKIEIYSIEKLPRAFDINNYSAVIIGFPTIHSEPAKPIMMFLNNLPPAETKISTFIFTTCGLYSTNTLRIFAKECVNKNLIPVLNRSYRCAAVDGILLVPFMKYFYQDEKNIQEKVKKDLQWFRMHYTDISYPVIPKLKRYSLLNYINKLIGNKYRFRIYLHKARCIRCGKCYINCPVQAVDMDKDNYPVIVNSKCINCYRCIHHCPKLALSLLKKHPVQKTLYIR
jgi:ferredoxin